MTTRRIKPTLGATTTLDRQSAKRSDDAYLGRLKADAAARYMMLADTKPVITSNETRSETGIRWFTGAELKSLELPLDDAMFLGVEPATGAGRFALSFTEHRVRYAPGALEVTRPIVDLRTLAMQGSMQPADLSLVSQAKALAHWHEASRCCGRCGGTTTFKDGGWKRKCWACGEQHFPRTDPVVIMLIVDGDRCLLGHESRFAKEPRMYSALAGFVEPGEDIEHAVRREVLEEAGIVVGDVAFHSSQPWAFPHSLMIGCIGHATSTAITIDPVEIEEARWFSRPEIVQMLAGTHPEKWWVPGEQAIARSLIEAFANGET